MTELASHLNTEVLLPCRTFSSARNPDPMNSLESSLFFKRPQNKSKKKKERALKKKSVDCKQIWTELLFFPCLHWFCSTFIAQEGFKSMAFKEVWRCDFLFLEIPTFPLFHCYRKKTRIILCLGLCCGVQQTWVQFSHCYTCSGTPLASHLLPKSS